MTPAQNKAQAIHRKALRNYATAENGQRERYRRELEAAARDVLAADIEARKMEEQRVHA